MIRRGSVYPYKFRIYDSDLANTFKILSTRRAVKIKDASTSAKIRKKLKPVRRDIFWGMDRRYYRNFIALPPNFDMDFKINTNFHEFIIKPIF